MVVPPDPDRVPAQRPLVPSVTLVMSVANDKVDNETIPGLCTYLQLRKPQKTSGRRTSDEGVE